jgi:hypothetical protein
MKENVPYGEAPTDLDDDEPPFNHEDDFYDDLSHLYLVSGEVWPEGMSLDSLPKLEASVRSLRLSDFFEDLAPDLEK